MNLVFLFIKIVFFGSIFLNFIKCDRVSPISGRLKKRDVNFYLSYAKNDWNSFNELLKPIAVKRISDTPEIENVKNFITTQMKSYGWLVEHDTFTDQTPFGVKKFTNIITTLPVGSTFKNADKLADDAYKLNHINNRVVLACHYDSKYFKNFDFIGAVDSAVPCAMLIDIAKFLNEILPLEPSVINLARHLQFMFFDGEEAFQDWTETDSLYGSRHLVSTLHSNYSKKAFDSIDLFVLLDLIGASESQFLNHFPQTSHVYNLMAKIENLLIKKMVLNKKQPYYFPDLNGYNGIYRQVEDDHKPFLKYGVPVLHLIPVPFPLQWHRETDTVANLNQNNIQDLRLILKYFVLEVLHSEKKKKKIKEDEL